MTTDWHATAHTRMHINICMWSRPSALSWSLHSGLLTLLSTCTTVPSTPHPSPPVPFSCLHPSMYNYTIRFPPHSPHVFCSSSSTHRASVASPPMLMLHNRSTNLLPHPSPLPFLCLHSSCLYPPLHHIHLIHLTHFIHPITLTNTNTNTAITATTITIIRHTLPQFRRVLRPGDGAAGRGNQLLQRPCLCHDNDR